MFLVVWIEDLFVQRAESESVVFVICCIDGCVMCFLRAELLLVISLGER